MDYKTPPFIVENQRFIPTKKYDFTTRKKGTAFCECCRTLKPIKVVSYKGWKCDDCKLSK